MAGAGGKSTHGKHEVELRALAHFALNTDSPVVALDAAVDGRQPQPCSPTGSLGSEERFEDTFLRLCVHAHAGVGDHYLKVWPDRKLPVALRLLTARQFEDPRREGQRSTIGHRIASVNSEIEQRILDL